MSDITLRSSLNRALTHDEVDANFSNLNADKYEKNDAPSFADTSITGDLTVDTNTLYVDSVGDRVGVNQASPLYTLHVSSRDSAQDTLDVFFENANPFGLTNLLFGPTSNPDEGMVTYDQNTNSLSFTVNTNKVVTIDSSGNTSITGNLAVDTNTLYVDAANDEVGINTATPAAPLHVSLPSATGTYAYFDTDGTRGLEIDIQNSSNGRARNKVNLKSGDAAGEFGFFGGAGTEYLTINNVGNVGIGTSSPIKALDIAGELRIASTADHIGLVDTATSKRFDLASESNSFTISDGSTERMRITSAGNVGIGTSSPQGKMHIVGTTTIPSLGSDGGALYLGNTTSNDYGLQAGVTIGGDAWLQVQRNDGTATAYGLVLQPNGGNVGIGTSPATKLHIADTTSPIFRISETGVRSWDLEVDGGAFTVKDATAAAERMRIDSSGNLLVGLSSTISAGTGTHRVQTTGLLEVITGEFADCDDAYVNVHGGVAEFMSAFQPANRPGTSNYVWIRSRTQVRGGTVYITQECTGIGTNDLHVRAGSGTTAATVTWGSWSAK